jgi:hypothetical protein
MDSKAPLNSSKHYQALDPEKVIATIEILCRRINERFPERGLSAVCGELLRLANNCSRDAARIRRPNWSLRILASIGFLGFIAVLIAAPIMIWGYAWPHATEPMQPLTIVQGLDAAFNITVLMSLGLLFLTGLEDRMKRRQAFKSLHRLRSITHVIDMHQLTKDPVSVAGRVAPTASSPKRELTPGELARYLDYCTEMLSLTGKIAALYAQNSRDGMIIKAANDIEELTTGLSRKIWQKLMILQYYSPAIPQEEPPISGPPATLTPPLY